MKKKKGLTIFARGVVYLAAAVGLAMCFIFFPIIAYEEGIGKPYYPQVMIGFLVGIYILATPFFAALFQAHKLLNYIDKNKAFSPQSVHAFKNIKLCAMAFSILVVVEIVSGISLVKIIGPGEDVAPFVTIGFLLTFASSVLAVAAAVMQKLITDAVDLKSENDLIV